MDREETSGRSEELHPASQLTELLACERGLAALLEAARDEARRLVESARAEAGAAAADLEASLEEESERERARIRAETQKRVRRLVAEARERAERFEGVSEGRVGELAEFAFRRLVSAEDAP